MAEFTNIKINDVQYDVKDANAARASALATKQDAISDLATIRSGASKGATAIQQADLAAVATSGSYNDLTDKPVIPTAVTVDSTITQNGTNPVQGGAIYSALEGKTDKPMIVEIVDWGTYREESSDFEWTGVELSFSYQEIMSAWNSGRQIYISDGENLYSLAGDPSEGYPVFSSSGWEGTANPTLISVGSDDSVSIIHHDYAVPRNRTVNGKALSSNITLTASDVGALPSNTHIPADQVQSNWNETNTSSKAYIQNKPTIPAAQVNADWNATSGVSRILNKPTIPTVPTKVSSFTNDAGYLTQHQSLANYYTKSEIDTKIGNIETLLASI